MSNPFEDNLPDSLGSLSEDPDLGHRLEVVARYAPGWTITSVWFAGTFRPELAHISFEAPDGRLGPSMLQRLPLGTLLNHHREVVAAWSELTPSSGVEGLEAFGVPDGLRRVAEVYRAAMQDPNTKSVHEVVAQHLGLSRSSANKKIMKARAAKLLPPRNRNTR